MADTDDEHTREKIRYIKINYKKEIDAIFLESIDSLEKAFDVYNVYEKVYKSYRYEQKNFRLHDNFFRVLKSHLNGLVDLHLIFECFENYRKKNRTWKVASC